MQRIVATADFGNGISRALDFKKWVSMNPDLTVHVTRYPQGEWVALAAESAYGHQGRGLPPGLFGTPRDGWVARRRASISITWPELVRWPGPASPPSR